MSAAIRAGYKQTEVGVIPGDWEVAPLSNLSEFITSGSRGWATYYADRGALFVRSQNVRDGRLDFADRQFVNAPMGAEGNRTRLKRSDLLITITGNSVGNVALVEEELGEAYISQHVGLVRLSDPSQGSYICRFLAPGSAGNEQIFASQSGQSKPGLSLKNLQEFLVALPPVSEQRAIATALSDVDALLAKLDEFIAKKRDLKQAAMQQLLTGQNRLPGFSGEWAYKRLKDVAMLNPGINKPISEMGSGVLYVTVQDLYDGNSIRVNRLGRIRVSESELQTHALIAGDIIFGKSSVKRDGIGYPSIYLGAVEPAVATGFSYRTRAFKELVDPKFLFYALRWDPTRKWLVDNSQASALTNINKSIADSIPIPLPPIDQQIAIATILSDMDAEIAALEARRDKTRALKQGMMQELLTGRIRLV